jgi:hypothetical protein
MRLVQPRNGGETRQTLDFKRRHVVSLPRLQVVRLRPHSGGRRRWHIASRALLRLRGWHHDRPLAATTTLASASIPTTIAPAAFTTAPTTSLRAGPRRWQDLQLLDRQRVRVQLCPPLRERLPVLPELRPLRPDRHPLHPAQPAATLAAAAAAATPATTTASAINDVRPGPLYLVLPVAAADIFFAAAATSPPPFPAAAT